VTENEPAPAPPAPAAVLPLLPLEPEGVKSHGCLKWGLIGCSAFAVVVVVGLIFASQRLMDVALSTVERSITASMDKSIGITPRIEFGDAMKAFTARAKKGGVPADEMTAFKKKVETALADNKVTTEELAELTKALKK